MSVRERKKRQTRTRILEVASKHFLHKDYDQVKLSNISKEANIAEGTLYNYYPDKSSLFIDVFAGFVTLDKEPLSKAHPNTLTELLDTFEDILCYYLELKDAHSKKLFQTFYHQVKGMQLQQNFKAYQKLEDLSSYIYLGMKEGLKRIFKKETATLLFPIIKYQINALHEEYVYNLLTFDAFLTKVKSHLYTILRPYYERTSI